VSLFRVSLFDVDVLNTVVLVRRNDEQTTSQRRLDDFIVRKQSPNKTNRSSRMNTTDSSALPGHDECCPICHRLIPDDILEIHMNACSIRTSESAKALVDKIEQRTKTEAQVKQVLFQRTTRKNLAVHLIKSNSETTTCTTCGMQMTLSRLENHHRSICSMLNK
jgi:hypothetical protein